MTNWKETKARARITELTARCGTIVMHANGKCARLDGVTWDRFDTGSIHCHVTIERSDAPNGIREIWPASVVHL